MQFPLFKKTRSAPPAHWRFPDKVCILAATPRSGSSFLAHAMISTGLLGITDEYFNFEHLERAYGLHEDVLSACELAASRGASENGVVSFKLFPPQLDRMSRDIELTQWFPNPTWIWLKRRDVLGQAISYSIAHQTKSWNSLDERQSAPEFSFREIRRRMHDVILANSAWEAYFAEKGINPLIYWYEDIEKATLPVLREIAERLAIDSNEMREPEIPIKIQRTELNEQWRKDYFAIAQRSKDGPRLSQRFDRSLRNIGAFLFKLDMQIPLP